MNKYNELKNRHQDEYNKFPIEFAFDDKQFKRGMESLGLKETDTDKVVGIGYGGFIRKEDFSSYKEMLDRHYEELQNEIKNDLTGEGFIKDMFVSEMLNHEYGYTNEICEVLSSLGLTYAKVMNNDNLKHGLELAEQEFSKEEKDVSDMEETDYDRDR